MWKNILIVGVAVVLAGGAAVMLRAHSFYSAVYRPSALSKKVSVTPAPPKMEYNILLLGFGGPGHDGSYLTDTIMVAHLDLKRHRATIVSIPRDIWVSLPTKSGTPYSAKINTVYEDERFPDTLPDIQSDNLVKNTIEHITGLAIDHTVTIDFDGFKKALDIIGGVDINVARTFTDREYPIDGHEDDLCGKTEADLPDLIKVATDSPTIAFPCRYETLHFDAGQQHMDGLTALKYVRSRHGDNDSGDFGRAARQQLFLDAIKDRVFNVSFVTKIAPLLSDLENHLTIDIPPELMQRLLAEAPRAKQYTMHNLVMSNNDYLDFDTSSDGQSILVPKAGADTWGDVKAWIHNTIEDITPTPTRVPITPTIKPAKTPSTQR